MDFFRSFKYRFYILVVGSILFFPVVWKLALGRTFATINNNQELNNKLAKVEDAPRQIAYVEKNLNYLNQILAGSEDDKLQNRVLDEISILCKKKRLLLTEMPPMITTLDKNYLVETINVQISGSFHNLLKLLYEIEKPEKGINIVSAKFNTVENKRLKTKRLSLSLYIQTLKRTS